MRLSIASERRSLILEGWKHTSGNRFLNNIYKNMVQEFRENRDERQFAMLWDRLSPSGNIYRYIGAREERLRHCQDLQAQLWDLSREYSHLLSMGSDGGSGNAGQPPKREEQRSYDRLVKLLKDARPSNTPFFVEEEDEEPIGFLPMEEFLDGTAKQGCFMILPGEADEQAQWRKNHFLGIVVLLIQVLAPFLVVVQTWQSDDNQLRDPRVLWSNLSIKEGLCLGDSLINGLVTIIGTLFLIITNTIILDYAEGELENAEKTGRLPVDLIWGFLGTLANSNCCLLISFGIPMELWSEEGTVGIAMNCMALIFIFTLDDLTGDAFGYIGKDDESFQRDISWQYALLSHCPIQLSDLINKNAAKPEELWKISYSATGQLLKANGRGAPCATRVMDVEASPEPAPRQESSPPEVELGTVRPGSAMASTQGGVDGRTGSSCSNGAEAQPGAHEDDDDEEDVVPLTRYHVTKGKSQIRPGPLAAVQKIIWTVVVFILRIVWWVVPIVWFITSKPCKDDEGD